MKTTRQNVVKTKNLVGQTEKMRHSAAHLLAAAVLQLYPDTILGVGPVIENGFYYDFLFSAPVSLTDLEKIEKRMRLLVEKNWQMTQFELKRPEALGLMRKLNQPFKIELIDDLPAGETISFYRLGEGDADELNNSFTDLCAGPHIDSLSQIGAFKLTGLAGAYWKGSEKNQMLTRIYGLAFDSDKELVAHLEMLAEAEKRDHRKVGPQLDLFTFSDLIGPGLPLWTPRGTVLRDLLDDFVWQLRSSYGYQKVEIPHLTRQALYEKSGHWDKFKDELFKINSRENRLYALKPMNCPHHTQIFARRPWSWRDMPQRYANTTMVYRDEQSGELSGLSRVLSITQDDAHVFCRPEQVKTEIENIWEIIERFYGTVGFGLSVRLSFSDPTNPDSYLGDRTVWQTSEKQLQEIADSRKADYLVAMGEAAFYGPKIDFIAEDSLKRRWQVATIQLDMNMPSRFDLSYTERSGQPATPVMIHAAIMGSLERYISILIEHLAGVLPLWLAPTQVVVLPISERHVSYAEGLFSDLSKAGFRVELDADNETLNKKIRRHELQKIPYLLIVGDKEQADNSVSVRKIQKGDLGQVKVNQLISEITSEVAEKRLI